MNADLEEQEDELLALESIFGSEEFVRNESKSAGEIRVSVELPADFKVALKEGETLRQYEISFLTALVLTFDLPEDYPSCSPPSFTLTCSWLTYTQLAALSAQLGDLYQATGGAVVLFSWVQFLREDSLKFLDIHSLLELPSDGHSIPEDKPNAATSHPCDSDLTSLTIQSDLNSESNADQQMSAKEEGALPSSSSALNPDEQGAASPPDSKDDPLPALSLTPSQALMSQILIHNAAQKRRAFASTVFDCGVCFTGWLGSDCVQLLECEHIFCQGCLGEFCKVQITEGNVRGLTCPQTGCTSAPTPAQVKRLVGEELFSRYDRLLLQSTLDCMPDVVYCPRLSCGSPVILDKSSNAALCSVCSFAFCAACRKTYHGTGDCQRRKLTHVALPGACVDLPQSQEGMKALWDDYTHGSKERQRLLESRYGRDTLRSSLETGLSDQWVSNNSKACPHCFWRIQKISGCNAMRCGHCGQLFCWGCLDPLFKHGYGHFQGGSCSNSFAT
ncbi:E3 ubiquitin-protein ligase RNF14-like [Parambassis ranga]|uniref:RBR-type E3 ubiquitin transferase n=1 Tax=Parambassis ranga TaxID=210632 RepID=A0A6P7I369_9TELE|nr:E3 ubiquitin-protein ligase RNF14-like [Parambassis ranga]